MTFIADESVRCPRCRKIFLTPTNVVSVQEYDLDLVKGLSDSWWRCPYCGEIISSEEKKANVSDDFSSEGEKTGKCYDLVVLDEIDSAESDNEMWPPDEQTQEAASIVHDALRAGIEPGYRRILLVSYLDKMDEFLVFLQAPEGETRLLGRHTGKPLYPCITYLKNLLSIEDPYESDEKEGLMDCSLGGRLYRCWVRFPQTSFGSIGLDELVLDADILIRDRDEARKTGIHTLVVSACTSQLDKEGLLKEALLAGLSRLTEGEIIQADAETSDLIGSSIATPGQMAALRTVREKFKADRALVINFWQTDDFGRYGLPYGIHLQSFDTLLGLCEVSQEYSVPAGTDEDLQQTAAMLGEFFAYTLLGSRLPPLPDSPAEFPEKDAEHRAKWLRIQGGTSLANGHFYMARTYMEKASKLTSNDPVVWDLLGSAFHGEQNFADACRALEKAVDLSRSSACPAQMMVGTVLRLARIYSGAGRLRDASEMLLQALKAVPEDDAEMKQQVQAGLALVRQAATGDYLHQAALCYLGRAISALYHGAQVLSQSERIEDKEEALGNFGESLADIRFALFFLYEQVLWVPVPGPLLDCHLQASQCVDNRDVQAYINSVERFLAVLTQTVEAAFPPVEKRCFFLGKRLLDAHTYTGIWVSNSSSGILREDEIRELESRVMASCTDVRDCIRDMEILGSVPLAFRLLLGTSIQPDELDEMPYTILEEKDTELVGKPLRDLSQALVSLLKERIDRRSDVVAAVNLGGHGAGPFQEEILATPEFVYWSNGRLARISRSGRSSRYVTGRLSNGEAADLMTQAQHLKSAVYRPVSSKALERMLEEREAGKDVVRIPQRTVASEEWDTYLFHLRHPEEGSVERIIAESLYCPKETDPPEFTLLKRVLEAARQPLEDEELYVPEAIRLIYWLGEDLSEAERNHAPECPGIVVKYLERFGATGNARPDKPMIRPPHIQLPPGTDERGWRAMLLLGTEAAEVYHALEGKTFFTAADVGVFRHEGKCFCLAFVPLFEILE